MVDTAQKKNKGLDIPDFINEVISGKTVSSATQMRSAMFLPYSRIRQSNIFKTFKENAYQTIMFENSLYKLEVKDHLLGQDHRDILDVLFSQFEIQPTSEGTRAGISFSYYEVLDALGKKPGGTNYEWLEMRLDELKRATFTLTIKDEQKAGITKKITFSILDRIVEKQNRIFSRESKGLLTFSTTYLQLLSSDILVNYREYVPQIVRMHSDIAKAFARYILSHRYIPTGTSIKDVLSEIELRPENMTTRSFSRIKKELMSEVTAEELSRLGIEISSRGMITYRKPESVEFYIPTKHGKQLTLFDMDDDEK